MKAWCAWWCLGVGAFVTAPSYGRSDQRPVLLKVRFLSQSEALAAPEGQALQNCLFQGSCELGTVQEGVAPKGPLIVFHIFPHMKWQAHEASGDWVLCAPLSTEVSPPHWQVVDASLPTSRLKTTRWH